MRVCGCVYHRFLYPPNANANNALGELHHSINAIQNKHPDALYVIAEDFNHVKLTNILPELHKHVHIATWGGNTFLLRVHKQKREHITVAPAYRCPLNSRKPTQKTITVLPVEAEAALQDCVERTDWQMSREAATVDVVHVRCKLLTTCTLLSQCTMTKFAAYNNICCCCDHNAAIVFFRTWLLFLCVFIIIKNCTSATALFHLCVC